jgi:hypothetical protein
MGIKTREDYINYCKLMGYDPRDYEEPVFLDEGVPLNQEKLAPHRGADLRSNLSILLMYAMEGLPRKDINMGSEAARKNLSDYLAKAVLKTAEDKNWWDKYFYSL